MTRGGEAPDEGPVFFPSSAALRGWLQAHHASAQELVMGLYKKGTGKPSITWPELVDQVLCFGWIDGVRRSLDEERYTIRITPRRRGSVWSALNVRRARELIEAGLMAPAGTAAFAARDQGKTERYSYERERAALGEELEAVFRSNPKAWSFFEAQPPSYRRTMAHWVTSAKREETRLRRLTTLIEESARRRRIGIGGPEKASESPGAGAESPSRRAARPASEKKRKAPRRSSPRGPVKPPWAS